MTRRKRRNFPSTTTENGIQAAALSGCLVPGLDREFPLFIQDLENPGNGEKFKKNLDISLPLLYNLTSVVSLKT